MNQTRRTLLQALIGLFSLGAAKAVAKTEPKKIAVWEDPQVIATWNRLQAEKKAKPQYAAAIGLVARNGKVYSAWHHINDGLARHDMQRSDFATEDVSAGLFDRLSAWVSDGNAMIFAEANGPDGAELVAELMKRCPERVWHGGSFDKTNPGLRFGLSMRHHMPIALAAADWESADRDQCVARYLALCGKDHLSGTKTRHVLVLE